MNKLAALNTEGQPVILGRTEVVVYKKDTEGGREQIKAIHKGIVIGEMAKSGYLRVYNPLPTNQGGDTAPENSEWFPRDSKLCWCVITNVRKEEQAFRIPPTLR
jgi:hypothetical protein